MLEIALHVDLVPDETMPGTVLAHVTELGISTVLRAGEDPLPILADLVRSTLQTLDDVGKLEETLARLSGRADIRAPVPDLVADFHLRGADAAPPPELVADYHLKRSITL